MTDYGTYQDASFNKDTERTEFQYNGKTFWVEYRNLGWRKTVELQRKNQNKHGETVQEDFIADYLTEAVVDSSLGEDTIKWVNANDIPLDFIDKVADAVGIGDDEGNLN